MKMLEVGYGDGRAIAINPGLVLSIQPYAAEDGKSVLTYTTGQQVVVLERYDHLIASWNIAMRS